MTLQFDEILKNRHTIKYLSFALLESPKFALHGYQTLDTYTIYIDNVSSICFI